MIAIRPGINSPLTQGPGGIGTVIRKWYQHMPMRGYELIESGEFDVEIVHAGIQKFTSPRGANIAAIHGLYWTAEYPDLPEYEIKYNKPVIESIREARAVTVPSEFVAETIRREFRINPTVVPHGVDVDEWSGGENKGYVLWAKGTSSGICNPRPVNEVAALLPDIPFRSTFGVSSHNVAVNNGPLAVDDMKQAILNCGIYLHTVPETWGIATLEALAAGKPVVAFEGGYLDYVRHGINGYIVPRNDYKAMARGIEWCMENYDVLSRNARTVAAEYTWGKAIDALSEAIDNALEPHVSGVSFVITSRNKGHKLARAIDSALQQDTRLPIRVVVVDDGSTDNTQEVLEGYRKKHQIHSISIPDGERAGVAHARNVGFDAAMYETVVTLDGDDAVTPDYVSRLYPTLHHSNATGVVYSGMSVVDGHGKITHDPKWFPPFEYDAQVAGRNCVPSCAMMKKDVWRRVGGFRPYYNRWHLFGAGTEDAAFWLMASAIGYDLKKVTADGLFLHSTGGNTSRNYTEVPWNNPWNLHGHKPIGAPHGNGEHPNARVYTPPRVSIIIPVGPGHETYASSAIDSAASQTYYRSEVIVVWDSPKPVPRWYLAGYPFVKWVVRPKKEAVWGAGKARNRGVKAMHPQSKYIVFLDSDDILAPAYVERTYRRYRMDNAIIYASYNEERYPRGTEDINQPSSISGFIRSDPVTGLITHGRHMLGFNAEVAKAQPDERSYVWCPVTTLTPRKWYDAVGGFREDLPAWEDWDLHIRLAKAGYPYILLDEPLFLYRIWTGKRRDYGNNNQIEENLRERMITGGDVCVVVEDTDNQE